MPNLTPQRNQTFSSKAESLVASLLRQQNWQIVAQNWRTTGTELDLVAMKGSTLVIVEVKARRRLRGEIIGEALPRKKRAALRRGAMAFLSAHPECWGAYTVRFDLALVEWTRLNHSLAVRYLVDVLPDE